MDEGLRLSQQQRLQQRLNPQQVRFGRLLEMSVPEFEEEVGRMLDENPALTRADEAEPARDNNDAENGEFNETAEEFQLADYGSEDDIPAYRLETRYRNEGDDYSAPVAADESDTGMASLTAQLSEVNLDETDRETASYIIGSIDGNGYLTRTPAAIASDIRIATGLPVGAADVERVLGVVQSLEPAGIAATDLRECLLLQLRRRERTVATRTALEIIDKYFDLFAKKHFDKIRSALEITPEAFDEALAVIRSLNPKPGSLLDRVTSADRLGHIVPDFAVETSDDGRQATVTLLGNVPELCVEESFRIDDDAPVPAERHRREAYIFRKARRDDAATFIKLMQMRASTLMSTAKAIVAIQAPFFATGERAKIKPMVLRDIADATGLDISVISRATAGKYILTRHGVYPLKMFFNERVTENSDTSSHEMAEAVASLIKNEDKKHPLSDDAITTRLREQGYDVARRTVAKYRERLGLPVARLRRQ